MMLVRILLALLNSKLDPYGADLWYGGPQDFLMLIITFKRLYFILQNPLQSKRKYSNKTKLSVDCKFTLLLKPVLEKVGTRRLPITSPSLLFFLCNIESQEAL